MHILNPLPLPLLLAQLSFTLAATIPPPNPIRKHPSQPPNTEIRVPPFFLDTRIPPPNRLLYPTAPFRLVTNEWTYPNANVAKYLAQGAFPPGDVLFTTNDSTKSPIFNIDAQQRLFHYDTLAQLAPNGERMYAFYCEGWYDIGRAVIVAFNTVERIRQWGYIYHEWAVEKGILYAVNPYNKERKPLVMQLCDQSYRNLWVMWEALEVGCTQVVVTVEYLGDDEY